MSLLAHADHHMAHSGWDLYTVVPVAVIAVIAVDLHRPCCAAATRTAVVEPVAHR